jgi:hypothetical protein
MVTSRLSRTLVHRVRLGLLGLIVLGLGWVLLQAFINSAVLTRHPCTNSPQPLGVPWSGYAVFGALGAFCLGALVGYWRHASGLGGAPLSSPGRADGVVHVALAVFFLTAVVLLGYETWAEWDPATRWPITAFVRCADRNSFPYALATAATVSFLLGQWLWHPWEAEAPTKEDGDA